MESGKKGTLIMVVRHELTDRGPSVLMVTAHKPMNTDRGRSYAKEEGTPS